VTAGPAPGARADPRTVADLAYGHTDVDGRGIDVTWLLDAIDTPTVTVDGVRRRTSAMWFGLLRDLTEYRAAQCGAPVPLVVGVPSTWGSVRRAVIDEAAARLRCPVLITARATLVAAAHADRAVRRCAVIETTHLPTHPDAFGQRPFWTAAIVVRSDDGWVVDAQGIIEPDRSGDDIGGLIDDSVEVVVVDGAVPAEVARAVEVVTGVVVAGRVLTADRALVREYGLRGSPQRRSGPGWVPTEWPRRAGGRRYRPLMAAAVVLLCVLVSAAGAAIVLGGDPVARPRVVTADLDRVRVSVPGQWRRTDPPAGAARSGPRRTVFADPADGRRLIVVLSPVRAGATQQSVALSLRNRIRQRGDAVVTEFSASTGYAGRDVISYREAPGSGSPIRWYVLVSDGLQVSVGCQDGDQAQSLAGECVRAVSSVRIGRR